MRGIVSPCCFYCPRRDVSIVVHGDDFIILATRRELLAFRDMFKQNFEIKFRGILGPRSDDVTEVRILNRVIRWTGSGLEYEGDHRHA